MATNKNTARRPAAPSGANTSSTTTSHVSPTPKPTESSPYERIVSRARGIQADLVLAMLAMEQPEKGLTASAWIAWMHDLQQRQDAFVADAHELWMGGA